MSKAKTPHKDCPFTQEEMDEFHYALYNVAAANNITAHKAWIEGFNRHECNKVHNGDHEAYRKVLLRELAELNK